MKYLNFLLGAILTIYACGSSAADDDGTSASTAASTANAAVVETNHGEGLGPNGADLHIDSKAASSDAEILQKSLDDIPQLQTAPPSIDPEIPTENGTSKLNSGGD